MSTWFSLAPISPLIKFEIYNAWNIGTQVGNKHYAVFQDEAVKGDKIALVTFHDNISQDL